MTPSVMMRVSDAADMALRVAPSIITVSNPRRYAYTTFFVRLTALLNYGLSLFQTKAPKPLSQS